MRQDTSPKRTERWADSRGWLVRAMVLVAAVGFAAAPTEAKSVGALIREVDLLLRPWHGEGMYGEADQQRLMDYTRQALAKAREAEKIAPGDPRVLHRLGVCLSLLKRYEEAEEAFARAEQRADPDFLPIVLQDRALCAMRQGQYERALKTFQRVLSLRPWQPDTRYHMGLIYERWGQRDRALRLYAQELNYNNRNSKAWQAYFRLKGLVHDPQGRSWGRTLMLLGVWVGVLVVAGLAYLYLRHRRSREEVEAAFNPPPGPSERAG